MSEVESLLLKVLPNLQALRRGESFPNPILMDEAEAALTEIAEDEAQSPAVRLLAALAAGRGK